METLKKRHVTSEEQCSQIKINKDLLQITVLAKDSPEISMRGKEFELQTENTEKFNFHPSGKLFFFFVIYKQKSSAE